MEPIAASGPAAVFRPSSAAVASELEQLLRPGRVLAAEVLANTGDGTLLLALGRHSVPAETSLRLDPGASFLVRVEEGANGIVLQLLGDAGGEESELIRALRTVVGEDRPIGELLGDLRAALRAGISPPARPGGPSESLAALVEALARHVALPGAGGAALQALLASSGIGHEAALAAALGGAFSAAAIERLRSNLKALLLNAHAALEDGPVREALARALSGLEAEQLLNLARAKAGEPLVLSFPFPDGEAWATARLLVPPRREREDGEAREGRDAFRVALGLELSGLGPVRADLVLAPGALSVRVLVTRAELARRIEADLGGLRERLGDGQRGVQVQVRVGTREEASIGEHPLDTRYLHENRLMNVAG